MTQSVAELSLRRARHKMAFAMEAVNSLQKKAASAWERRFHILPGLQDSKVNTVLAWMCGGFAGKECRVALVSVVMPTAQDEGCCYPRGLRCDDHDVLRL